MPNLTNLVQVITHPPGDKHSVSNYFILYYFSSFVFFDACKITSPVIEFLNYKISEASISSEDLSNSLDYLVSFI